MSLLPEWGATLVREGYRSHKLFQSTLPVWGATRGSAGAALRPTDFNPRFPSGERRGHHQDHPRDLWISIHAPRVGSDLGGPGGRGICPISIHAPRVGSDRKDHTRTRGPAQISIHAPRVGSDFPFPASRTSPRKFQSTLPVWGATVNPFSYPSYCLFQSTLPVWGATWCKWH